MAVQMLWNFILIFQCVATLTPSHGVPGESRSAEAGAFLQGACHAEDPGFGLDADCSPALSLLQLDARRTSGQKAKAHSSSAQKHTLGVRSKATDQPAGWFGSFSQEESTYTYDGTLANRNLNPAVNVANGWNPAYPTPSHAEVEPPKFFYESTSGGYKEAWQSFFPSMQDVSSNPVVDNPPTGKWYKGTSDIWQQSYRAPEDKSHDPQNPGSLAASWFDSSVNQNDAFGRLQFPAVGSPRENLFWEERSAQTILTCEDPGCTAYGKLNIPFDAKTETYRDCKISVSFHPTDFDDQYSGERIEWVQVNGKQVVADCRFLQHGCDTTSWRPLLPCVVSTPIDTLMSEDGHLNVSAKIPEVVDECRYNGDLLSGVAEVTCMVACREGNTDLKNSERYAQPLEPCVSSMPLQCPTRGCAAEITMKAKACPKLDIQACKLSVTVNQTDYDNEDDTPELVEYIRINGKDVVKNRKPGENPCKSAWMGYPVPASELRYLAFEDYDVTDLVRNDEEVRIAGKISQYVDECASNGYLFDALAEITCYYKDKENDKEFDKHTDKEKDKNRDEGKDDDNEGKDKNSDKGKRKETDKNENKDKDKGEDKGTDMAIGRDEHTRKGDDEKSKQK